MGDNTGRGAYYAAGDQVPVRWNLDSNCDRWHTRIYRRYVHAFQTCEKFDVRRTFWNENVA